MKKTLSLLIATAICASGDVIYTSQDAQVGEYAFDTAIPTSNYTVAVTLDLTSSATSVETLFYLKGDYSSYDAITGLMLQNSKLGGFYRQSDSYENAAATAVYADWNKSYTNNNLPEGYTSLYTTPAIDFSSAQAVTLFFVGSVSGTYDYIKAYAYVHNSDGSTDKYTGTNRFNKKPFTNITGVVVNSVAVGSIDVYDSAMSVEEIEKIALSAPAVPEPTTATLSLLALAGLAARRRRA